jgi:GT2 family glycosyltransferase
MANPKVNVLIANHNYGEWIMDAVNSALDQTYPDISITIVVTGLFLVDDL